MSFKMCEEIIKYWRYCTKCGVRMLKGDLMHVYNWGGEFFCQKCEDKYNKELRR